jgi:chromosome segregation ATPase
MSGEVRCFRRRLFGFDANDVMQYISELAAQRNQYKRAGDRLEAEITQFKNEIAALRDRLAETERRVSEIGRQSLDSAALELSALQATYENLRSEMEDIAEILASELNRLGGTLTSLSAAFDETDVRLRDISSALENEKQAFALSKTEDDAV